MGKAPKRVLEKNFLEKRLFVPEEIKQSKKKKYIDVDLHVLYDKTINELGLQQTKRDQIIAVYIALYAFLTPAVLEAKEMPMYIQGGLFLAAAIIGFFLALIIIRYRIYKEVYWLCCQSISVFFGIKKKELKKELIQSVFYKVLEKKGKKYIKKKEDGRRRFRIIYYIRKNIFSSESIYFLIHTIITAFVVGLSLYMIFEEFVNICIPLAFGAGVIVGLFLVFMYFYECIKVYWVLVDHTDESFNKTFSKAWFLHFYV